MAISSLDRAANLVGFDRSTGKLSIFGTAGNNTVQEWISDDGYLQLMLDGVAKSSDPLSAFFDSRLQGATRDTLTHINFDGREGRDTLLVGNQSLDRLEIAADDNILINGNAIASGSLDVSADTITATGSLTGSKINLNSRDVLKLESGSKITSQDGDKGGTVHLLGKEVSLTGAAIDASGVNGGGTVLIGGDYQGKGSVPNARTTFIDASTIINVDALQNGDGGRAIVWADDSTRFLGKINARGGSGSGNGGFAEVSGKQNLSFQGLADLSATKGTIGTLLLDPTNILINNSPVDPNAEYPEGVQAIYSKSLEESAASISLIATDSILTVGLNFVSPGGSITFASGTGSFTAGSGIIKAPGRNVTITAGDYIIASGIDTSSETASGGSISLTGTNGIAVGSLSSTSTDNGGGDINLISKNGNISSGDVYASDFGSGIGGKVMLTAIDGEIATGAISGSSESGYSGTITVKAKNSINTEAIETTTLGTGTAGNIDVTSMSGSINTNGGRIAANSSLGNAGNINLQAAEYINTGGVNSRSDGTGSAGSITLNALGDIFAGGLEANVNGDGNGGDVSITTEGGSIEVKGAVSAEDNAISVQNISTFGGGNGNGGSITLRAPNSIYVGELNSTANGSGNAGDVNVTSIEGGISITPHVFTYATFGNAGNVNLMAAQSIGLAGGISASSYNGIGGNVNITSMSGGIGTTGIYSFAGIGNDAGSITLTAFEDIITGSILSRAFETGNGGKIKLKSEQGSIITTNYIDLNDPGDIHSNSGSGIGGGIEIDAVKDIKVGVVTSNSGGAGNGGAIALTSTDGNISTGSIRSDSTQGTGGNITIDAAKLVKVTGAENINDIDYSIYTDSVDDASGPKGASVTINNSQKVVSTPSSFIIGDATTNGTFAGVSDGVATFDTSEGGIHAFVVDGDLNDIHVKMPTFIASSGSPALNSALDNVIKGMLPFLKGLSPSSTLTPLDQVKTLVSVFPQVTLQQVLQIAPDANPQKASQLLPYLNVAMAIYGINTPIRKSHFFAQLIQESDSFNATEEYDDGSAYEGREDLGNTQPGDGKRFKGRGLIQITGRTVYTDFSNHLGLGQTLLKLPQLVSTNPALATLSAGYFWKIFKGEDLSLKADQDVETNSEEILRYITQKVNGDIAEEKYTYLSRRRVYLANAKQILTN